MERTLLSQIPEIDLGTVKWAYLGFGELPLGYYAILKSPEAGAYCAYGYAPPPKDLARAAARHGVNWAEPEYGEAAVFSGVAKEWEGYLWWEFSSLSSYPCGGWYALDKNSSELLSYVDETPPWEQEEL